MNRFQECSQSACLTIFHCNRGFCARGESLVMASTKRAMSRRNGGPASGAAKNASKPLFLRTTPGAPRSIKKFESASMFARLVRIDPDVDTAEFRPVVASRFAFGQEAP